MSREKLVYDGLQDCPYLDGRVARMPLYRQLERLSPEETDRRFANAERRVGHSLYRTQCPACDACKGIRIPVDDFRPSKSQRRVRRRWEGLPLRVEAGPPTWSPEKLALFNTHRRERGLASGKDDSSALGYVSWLVQSSVETVELRYSLGDRLVGVSILDLGATSMSSVYFYFDPAPDLARLAPGVFSVLHEVDLCRRVGKRWYYLGLYIEESPHMRYKASYRPYELELDGEWVRFER